MVFGADDFDVFISHASEDKAEIARPIFEACEQLGLKVFLDEAHIGWGQSFTKKINTALGSARTVLAIVSPLGHQGMAGDRSEYGAVAGGERAQESRAAAGRQAGSHALPLIGGKDSMAWSGDPVQVARLLRKSVARHSVDVKWRPSRPEPAAGSVPTVAAATARAQTPPERQRSWLQKVFRKPD